VSGGRRGKLIIHGLRRRLFSCAASRLWERPYVIEVRLPGETQLPCGGGEVPAVLPAGVGPKFSYRCYGRGLGGMQPFCGRWVYNVVTGSGCFVRILGSPLLIVLLFALPLLRRKNSVAAND